MEKEIDASRRRLKKKGDSHLFSDRIKFKPYYVAHTKIQTLALLDEQYKGSNQYVMRSQCERIRTAGEIRVNIPLPPLDNVALYHKIREKVVSLRALGMNFSAIAKSLDLNEKTVRKAFYCKGE
jgi:hypothetical protein